MSISPKLATLILSSAMVLFCPEILHALTPTEVNTIAKKITVKIDGDNLGSGVLFERQGNTYYVLTNRHVIQKQENIFLVTSDGEKYKASSTQELPSVDLAVLQFTSNKNYPLATLGKSKEISEGITVYVAGWSAKIPGIDERLYRFTNGSISSLVENPKDGYALVYNNEAIPGMSGGPVLNEEAEVIGINGRASIEGNTGTVLRLGIPIDIFLTARKNLQPLTAKTPVTAEDFIALAGIKAKEGNYQEALADYDTALKINPNNPDIYWQRSQIYFTLNNFQASLEDLDQVVRLSPKSGIAYFMRGTNRLLQGDKSGAKVDLDKAIELEPNNALFYSQRGLVRSDSDPQGANADFDQAIALDPNQSVIYLHRGLFRAQQGDKKGAIADSDKAVQLDPNNPLVYSNRGLIRLLSNDNQGALADFDKAISLDPNNMIVHFQRGAIRSELGDIQGALADLNFVIETSPNFTNAYYLRGIIRYQNSDHTGAIEDYTQALKINPQYEDAYLARANIYADQEDYNRAIADVTEVIKINPKNALAYAIRGYYYQKLGESTKAIADSNQSIQIDPENGRIYSIRGNIYHLQKDYFAALSAYEKSIKLLPKNLYATSALNNVGLIKYELGEVDSAIQKWQESLSIYSNKAETKLALAVAFYNQGKEKEALALAQEALKLDQRYQDVAFLQKNLWGEKLIADAQKLFKKMGKG